jgi:hypothetical protein
LPAAKAYPHHTPTASGATVQLNGSLGEDILVGAMESTAAEMQNPGTNLTRVEARPSDTSAYGPYTFHTQSFGPLMGGSVAYKKFRTICFVHHHIRYGWQLAMLMIVAGCYFPRILFGLATKLLR